MAGEHKVSKLSEVTRFSQGIQIPVTEQVSSPIPGHVRFIRISDYTSDADVRYVKYPGSQYECDEYDVVMVRYGESAGFVGRGIRGVIANNLFKITPNTPELDKRYLYWYLNQKCIYEYLKGIRTNSGMPSVSHSAVGSVNIYFPPLPEQQAIAHILGMLDDKIELNRRMNATLEAMARALFQSWFVDFDPVRAKLDGRQPAGLDKATAALFPAHFQDSPLGPIPQGWEVRSLDRIADYLNGLALQKYPPSDGPTLPVIKIAQLRKGDSEGADRCNTELPSEYIIGDGDVLFSWSGSLEVELWCGGLGALNQHLFKVTSQEFPKWFYYLWTLNHLDDFRLIAAGKATTMGHIQRGHLTAAKTLVPPAALIKAMTQIMSPLIDQIIANRIQSRSLAALRDTLLPKLLSGDLRVADINDLAHSSSGTDG